MTSTEAEAQWGFPTEFGRKVASILGVRGLTGPPGYRSELIIYNTTAPSMPFYTERKVQQCLFCKNWWNTTDEWMTIHRNSCSKKPRLIGTSLAPSTGVMTMHHPLRLAGGLRLADGSNIQLDDTYIRKIAKEEMEALWKANSKFMSTPIVLNDWSDVEPDLEVLGQLIQIMNHPEHPIYVYTKNTPEGVFPKDWSLISDGRCKCDKCGQVLPKQLNLF